MTITVKEAGGTLTTTTATIYTVTTGSYAMVSMIQVAMSSAAAGKITVERVLSTGTIVPLTVGKSVAANSSISVVAGGLTMASTSRIQALCETTAATAYINIGVQEDDGN